MRCAGTVLPGEANAPGRAHFAEAVAVTVAEDHKVEVRYAAGTRKPAGLTWTHRRPDGAWCTADIPLRGGDRRGGWIVILAEPLTVTPALRCPTCKSRAWLDGGSCRPF